MPEDEGTGERTGTGEGTATGSGDGRDEPGVTRGESVRRCDYCRLPLPAEPVTLHRDGVPYEFCSATCRDALARDDLVFTEYHGFRRLYTGVAAIDGNLPQGLPRNSFVLLADLPGTRAEAIRAELVWRALQRGEPVVFVSFLEPPVSVVQEFVSLEWNVLPWLERGDLAIVDCFSYRVEDRDRMYERMDAWNAHLWDVARGTTSTVRDPSDVGELQNRLDNALERVDARDRGLVVVDSLTELGSLVQPVQAYNFVKDVRADVCKGRFVPVVAGATVSGEADQFPHDLGYMVDGIVEMRLDDDLVEDALLKQLRVRKMSGVLSYPRWESFEYTAGRGMVTFDPAARTAATGDDPDVDGEGTNAPDGRGTAEGGAGDGGDG